MDKEDYLIITLTAMIPAVVVGTIGTFGESFMIWLITALALGCIGRYFSGSW